MLTHGQAPVALWVIDRRLNEAVRHGIQGAVSRMGPWESSWWDGRTLWDTLCQDVTSFTMTLSTPHFNLQRQNGLMGWDSADVVNEGFNIVVICGCMKAT